MPIHCENFIGKYTGYDFVNAFKALNELISSSKKIKMDTPLKEIDNAVARANEAFLVYRLIKPSIKISFLQLIADKIDQHRDQLSETASKETSLPNDRLQTEITRTINQLRLFAELLREGSWVRAIIDTAQPERKPFPKPDVRQMQLPLGPVAVFGASNFPFAYSVCGGDTVAALAAGCTVVYKANPGHPETSEAVSKIITDAVTSSELPDGVFTMVQGASNETGLRLVMHPLIKAVGFTGSFKGGRALYDACARREEPIPVYAEMGSTNPVFILPEILEQKGEEIAKLLAGSNTVSAGQFCTNPGIMVAQETVGLNKFYDEFSKAIRESPSAPMLTKSILNNFEKSMKEVSAKKEVVVAAVAQDDKKENAHAHVFIASGESFLNDHQLSEEMFGPSSIQVTAKDKPEMMKIAASLPGQLTATVWGTENDLKSNKDLIRLLELKAGRLIINNVPTGVEVTRAMMHGGPYPATTDSKFTSVGTESIYRFTRPVCYQNFPSFLLPDELI
ncbi:MAG TPA: aldehyde dehydrogenase (NADP(+)) [Flavitalea sp.]|nr:aldehyde dehydrogenase (NADP(+)) [Flavitalea sp.]